MAETNRRVQNTFNLEGFLNPVVVTLTPSISREQLLSFPAFKTWLSTLRDNLALQHQDSNHAFHETPFSLSSVTIQSVDWFGPTKIGFVKLIARITNKEGKSLPGIAFLRGGSVAMLMILRPKDSNSERLVVMTEQPRIPAGSLTFQEIPAGMLDDAKTFRGAAADEIEEETGFRIATSELIDLTELALKHSKIPEKSLQSAMYPSPGGSDEYISIFLWEKELDRQEIEDLRGKLTGKRMKGEMITLRVCVYEDLWREGARDAKTLAAWALYEGLNRAGILQDEIMNRRKGGAQPD